MSLISTLQRTESGQGNEQQQITSKRVASVYQQDGKPLSKEALYRYKLKYNNFQSQKPNSEEQEQELKAKRIKNGNIAAKLAVINVASEKENFSEIAAKRDSPEEHYRRLLVHPNASQIAATKSHNSIEKRSAHTKEKPVTNNSTLFSHETLVSAANKATKNGSMQRTSSGSMKMDFSKLKTVASETDSSAAAIQAKKFNLSKLLPQATKNAEKLEFQRQVSNIPIPIQGLKTKNEFDPLVHSKYEISTLSTLASKLADERVLASVKNMRSPKDAQQELFTNEAWNEIAVKMVLQNKQQILDSLKEKQDGYNSQVAAGSVKTGKNGRIYKLGDIGAKGNPEALISLGNGLTLTQGEVTKLASKVMLPLLSTIDADTKKQLIKQAEIDEEKRTFKVETVAYKEDNHRQVKREKAREVYEKKKQREEDKLVSKQEKLENKGEKLNMTEVLQKVKEHNDLINSNMEKIDVFAVDEAKQTGKISELSTGLEEIETVLKGLQDNLAEIEESQKATGVSAKDIQKNKYAHQLISSKIFRDETQKDSTLASLSLEKARMEDLSQKVALLESSNTHLQSSIDLNLKKLDYLKDLGRADKEKSELLANLKRENQINLRSKQVFIRSNFNKNLDDIIAKVKEEDDQDLKLASEHDESKRLERSKHKHFFENVKGALEETKAVSKIKGTTVKVDTEPKIEEAVPENAETEKEHDDVELDTNTITEDDEAENSSALVPPPISPEGTESNLKEVL